MPWHVRCSRYSRGRRSPREEVGKMGYLVIAIAYIILVLSAVMKPHTGHA